MKLRKGKKEIRKKKNGPLNILIVAKQNRTGIRMAKRLANTLKGKVKDLHFDRSTAIRLRTRGVSIRRFAGDFIITVGGDGTLLWTAQQATVPILPVKIEGHGFLCTCDYKELMDNINKLLAGKYTISERIRMRCTKEKIGIFDKFLQKPYPLALNEIVFARKRPSKILEIAFTIDDTVMKFVGDGLMFSTPVGSTAYSASAGGSIIDPDLEVIKVVPLYPFYSKLKPFVMPANKKIQVDIHGGECAVIIDGHGGEYVKGGAKFTVETGKPLKVINLYPENFYMKFNKEFIQ